MNNKIVYGEDVKREVLANIKKELKKLDSYPKLSVILIGDNKASNTYVNSKKKFFEEMNVSLEVLRFNNEVKEQKIISTIEDLNNNPNINGILVQLPIPKHLNESKIINTIDYKKDVDGLTNKNIGLLSNNTKGIIPCTAKAVMEILKYKKINLEGKDVTIVGRSKLVGKPLVNLFLKENATVTVCHSKTRNLKKHTKNAGILVVAVGKKHLINRDMIKEGSIIIDVGINKENGKLYGDVNLDDVINKCLFITPVPKGVGIMTVTMLLENLIECYYLQK